MGDLILAGAILVLAGALLQTKGNFSITVVHKQLPQEDIKQELMDFQKEMEKEISEEEAKFMRETQSLIGAINEIMHGKEEENNDGRKELK